MMADEIGGEVIVEMCEAGGTDAATLEAAEILITLLEEDIDYHIIQHQEPVEATIPVDIEPDLPVGTQSESSIGNEISSPTLSNTVDISVQTLRDNNTRSKKKLQKINYKRQKNQLLRQAGLKHQGVKHDKKNKKTVLVTIEGKKMGPPCKSTFCEKSANRHCHNCPQKDRKQIFKAFWKQSWAEKRYYVQSFVDIVEPKRKDIFSTKPRTKQMMYFLRIAGRRQQVCKKMFLSTLAIKEGQLKNWLSRSTKVPSGVAALSHVKCRQKTAAFTKSKKFVEGVLDQLPKLPSHFARADSDKVYLQGDFSSIRGVHRFVTSRARAERIKKVSWSIFLEIFHGKKLSVYELKKDCCDECEQYRLHYMTDEQFEYHRLCVMEARAEKSKDKAIPYSNSVLHLIVDLQKILLCPLLRNSLQYYLCKLQFRNYTLYDHHTHDVCLKVWDETEGGVDSSNFATLLVSHLLEKLEQRPEIKEIVIWSDGCAAQNRNIVLANTLLDVAMDLQVTITQKFFIKGHSQNEADSVHARIEIALKTERVYTPRCYVEVMANARLDENKNQYEVEVVDHTKFKKFDKVLHYRQLRPGHGPGDETVNHLRALQYLPTGIINYKLKFTEPWTALPHRLLSPSVCIDDKYQTRLPIKTSKFNDLQKLKKFIPEHYHFFYDNLPHQ